jgi:outer membrane protein TolC
MKIKIALMGMWALTLVALTANAETLQLSNARCRAMALEASEDLQKAELAYQQSELDVDIAKRAALPTLDGAALLEYITPDLSMSAVELQMRGMYVAGLNVVQPIYTGGKITAGKKLANIGREVSQQQLRLSRMDVLSSADQAYWSLVSVAGKEKMLRSYVAQMDTLYAQIQRTVNIGMATQNDLLRVESRRSEIQYNLKKVINGRNLCRLALCRVIGVDEGTEIEPTDSAVVVTEPGVMYNDISNRPELEMLNLAINANEQQVKMAKADYLPTIGLSLGYFRYGNIKAVTSYQLADGTVGSMSSTTNDGLGLAMLSVKIPIFNWGVTGKKVKKATYDLAKSQLDLEKNKRLLSIEVQQAINNVNDGYELIGAATVALRQARENLQNMQARYKVSMCPIIDLLDAQSQWQQAESNLIEARAQYRVYETEYLRVTGALQ